MTEAPERVWTWPIKTHTGITAWGSGTFRATSHRPLDDRSGPTGEEYVRADIAAELRAHIERLTDINAEQAATIARMMRKGAA